MKYDLVDRRCVITGASAGIGREIARNLAYFGASVVLACRDRDRGSAALHEIVHDSGNDRVSMLVVDLASRASIRTFVRNVTAGGAPVHLLVNNAAIMSHARQLGPDGIELTWATNVLGYFALTNLLLPSLRKNAPSRVVFVSCAKASGLDLNDVQFARRRYDGVLAHQQSKQADFLLAWRLASLCARDGINVHTCDPGRVATELFPARNRIGGLAQRLFSKSPARGAITPTFVAADPTVSDQSGRHWIDRTPQSRPFADDQAEQTALWRLCVEQSQCDA